jgi:magnesium chelatase family protein
MLARAHTFTIEGLQTWHVTVEVDVRAGLPAFTIVGLADAATREARERVRKLMGPLTRGDGGRSVLRECIPGRPGAGPPGGEY